MPQPSKSAAPDAAITELSIFEWVAASVAVLLALATRVALLSFASGDYQQYTGEWYRFIQTQGAVEALRSGISNYTPPYLYAMSMVEWLLPSLSPVIALKLIGLPFDFLCAFYVARIVGLRYRNRLVEVIAGLAVLFAPTVVINGSFWGQVDVVATTGVVACVYYLLCGRERAAMIAFGGAFAFKFQAVFLAPMLVVCLLRRRCDWRWLAIVPAIYLVAILPAWLVGRSLWGLLTIYADQASFYQRLSSNAAHVYQWLPASMYAWFYPAGMAWGLGVILIFTVAAVRFAGNLPGERMLQLALLSVVLVPYCLPKMHERYFFMADVLAIPYAFYFPRLAGVAVAITAVSFCSYAPFLFNIEILPLPLLAFVPGIVLLVGLFQYRSSLDGAAERY